MNECTAEQEPIRSARSARMPVVGSPGAIAAPRAKPLPEARERERRVLLFGSDLGEVEAVSLLLQAREDGAYAPDWIPDFRPGCGVERHEAFVFCLPEDDPAQLAMLFDALEGDGHPPVIVISRGADADDGARLIAAGAADYVLHAELSSEVLHRSLTHALARRRAGRAAATPAGPNLAGTAPAVDRPPVSRLIDGFCHDMRTPLSVVGEFADILLEDFDSTSPGDRQEFLSIIADRTRDLSRMVDDAAAAYRLYSGSWRPVHRAVDPLIRLREMEPKLRKLAAAQGKSLTFDLPPDLPAVFCDVWSLDVSLRILVDQACRLEAPAAAMTLWAREDSDGDDVAIGIGSGGETTRGSRAAGYATARRAPGRPADADVPKKFQLRLLHDLAIANLGGFGLASGPPLTAVVTLPAFDVARLLPRQVRYLLRAADRAGDVSVISVATSVPLQAERAERFGAILARRAGDGSFITRVQSDFWLLCINGGGRQSAELAGRISEAAGELLAACPGAPRFEVSTHVVGAWPTPGLSARRFDDATSAAPFVN